MTLGIQNGSSSAPLLLDTHYNSAFVAAGFSTVSSMPNSVLVPVKKFAYRKKNVHTFTRQYTKTVSVLNPSRKSNLRGKMVSAPIYGNFEIMVLNEYVPNSYSEIPQKTHNRTQKSLNIDYKNLKKDEVINIFKKNALKWKRDIEFISSINEITSHPSYINIIKLGQQAIPLILTELKAEASEPRMWFPALKILTGVDPVTDNERGKMYAMAKAWLDWGRREYEFS